MLDDIREKRGLSGVKKEKEAGQGRACLGSQLLRKLRKEDHKFKVSLGNLDTVSK